MKHYSILALIIFSFNSVFSQQPGRKNFVGTFTFTSFVAGGTSDVTGVLDGFNDQSNNFFANNIQVADVIWDNNGNRWEVMVVNSSNLIQANVDLRAIDGQGGVPIGVGFVSRETKNFGFSLFPPDNSIGISQQLKARVESHNMIIIDSLLNKALSDTSVAIRNDILSPQSGNGIDVSPEGVISLGSFTNPISLAGTSDVNIEAQGAGNELDLKTTDGRLRISSEGVNRPMFLSTLDGGYAVFDSISHVLANPSSPVEYKVKLNAVVTIAESPGLVWVCVDNNPVTNALVDSAVIIPVNNAQDYLVLSSYDGNIPFSAIKGKQGRNDAEAIQKALDICEKLNPLRNVIIDIDVTITNTVTIHRGTGIKSLHEGSAGINPVNKNVNAKVFVDMNDPGAVAFRCNPVSSGGYLEGGTFSNLYIRAISPVHTIFKATQISRWNFKNVMIEGNEDTIQTRYFSYGLSLEGAIHQDFYFLHIEGADSACVKIIADSIQGTNTTTTTFNHCAFRESRLGVETVAGGGQCDFGEQTTFESLDIGGLRGNSGARFKFSRCHFEKVPLSDNGIAIEVGGERVDSNYLVASRGDVWVDRCRFSSGDTAVNAKVFSVGILNKFDAAFNVIYGKYDTVLAIKDSVEIINYVYNRENVNITSTKTLWDKGYYDRPYLSMNVQGTGQVGQRPLSLQSKDSTWNLLTTLYLDNIPDEAVTKALGINAKKRVVQFELRGLFASLIVYNSTDTIQETSFTDSANDLYFISLGADVSSTQDAIAVLPDPSASLVGKRVKISCEDSGGGFGCAFKLASNSLIYSKAAGTLVNEITLTNGDHLEAWVNESALNGGTYYWFAD